MKESRPLKRQRMLSSETIAHEFKQVAEAEMNRCKKTDASSSLSLSTSSSSCSASCFIPKQWIGKPFIPMEAVYEMLEHALKKKEQSTTEALITALSSHAWNLVQQYAEAMVQEMLATHHHSNNSDSTFMTYIT